MTQGSRRARSYLEGLLREHGPVGLSERVRPRLGDLPPTIPQRMGRSPAAVDARWGRIGADRSTRDELLDEWTCEHIDDYARNVEHFIGTVKVPVGLAGPLRVNGLFARGDYLVPLATTEASLVASYSRGASLITEAGGAGVALLSEGVSRAPMLSFESLGDLGKFSEWALQHLEEIQAAANLTTRHGKLEDIELCIEGTKVYFLFIYNTADAAGQNMVTLATHAALRWILEHSPVAPRASYLESNFSGDKKASALSFQRVRGRKVVAEVTIPAHLVHERLRTSPDQMVEYVRVGTLGAVMCGALGSQGHFANGLAALMLACGQDVACVSEASVGVTDFELTSTGDLHACATLPNLIIGSVGGGTGLPSQRACLDILGVRGAGGARMLAEIAAAVCLAGELSLIGAICAGEFASAHARLARGRKL